MCIQVYIKLDFGINIGQIRLANKTWISVFDVRGRDKVQRWVGVGAKGGGGVWNTWCKCCSGLESLTCTEIWLLHITLLLSAESKANSPKHLN